MTSTATITAYGGKNVQTTGGFYGAYLKSTGAVDATGNMTSSAQVKGATLVSTGRTTVGEFVQINGTATAGASCSPNGLQGKSSTGALLSCVSGKWLSAAIGEVINVAGLSRCGGDGRLPSYAVCTAGYKLTGGGYHMTQWRNDSGGNAPDSAYPDVGNNRFIVNPPGGNDAGCFQANAICVR